MRILKKYKATAILVSIMMMAFLLYSRQVLAAVDNFEYTVIDGEAQIYCYIGAGGDITIPSTIDGYAVTSIASGTFEACWAVTSIRFNSATIEIQTTGPRPYDSDGTIPYYIKIIGHDPSTAKTYATEFDRTFEAINTTNTLQSIAITTPASKLSYTVNDPLDISGLVISGTYSNGSTIVESLSATNVTGFDSATPAASQTLTITIGGKTTTYNIEIKAAPEVILNSIAITTPATKLIYTVGDTLDLTGLVVTGTYSDDSTKVETLTAANVTGFDSSTAVVEQVLTITVADKTTTYKVRIVAAPSNEEDFIYTVTDGKAQITGYTGVGGVVTIPSTLGGAQLTSIGSRAFFKCTSLTSICIPQGVTSIGNYAFGYCQGLISINIPEGLTSICDGAFYNCTGLTSICIPQGVTSIGNHVFEYCKGLISINIPVGVTSIGDSAFYDCIGLTSISIPVEVTNIGDSAFYDCIALISISIPQNVTSIGRDAFHNCSSVSSINIPQSVTSIGNGAFSNCTGLTTITVAVDNLKYASIDGVLFNKAGTILMACPGGLTTISLPQGLTSIGDSAFSGCRGLTNVSIPQGVTSISRSAFAYCVSLSNISIPQGVTSIDYLTFAYCVSLSSISIPQGVTSIGEYAFFGCRGLTTISIPQAVTSVGHWAFYDCIGLTSIKLNSATTIIYDDSNTIPAATKIIGHDPSTAKTYATRYNRSFEVIGIIFSATPLVQIGINPNEGGSVGIFVGLKDIKDTQGQLVPDAKLASYQIEIDYDPAKVVILDVVDEANLGGFTKEVNQAAKKVTIFDEGSNDTTSFNKFFFLPIALTGSALDLSSIQVRYLNVRDENHTQIGFDNPPTLIFQRGKILNEGPEIQPNINDAVAGLQYLAGMRNSEADSGHINLINMASIVGPDINSTIAMPNVKDVIALMQYCVHLRGPYFAPSLP